jgi:hypothetical protein
LYLERIEMQLNLTKEHEDGSATFQMELEKHEVQVLILLGFKSALLSSLGSLTKWADDPELLEKAKQELSNSHANYNA